MIYSAEVELDLSDVVPSVAGPKRPQDRIDLPKLKQELRRGFHEADCRKRVWQAE